LSTNVQVPPARGIDTATANSILVKVNQIGSLTETLDAVELAQEQRLHRPSSSHRSGGNRRMPPSADIRRRPPMPGQIKTGFLEAAPIAWQITIKLLPHRTVPWKENAVYGRKNSE